MLDLRTDCSRRVLVRLVVLVLLAAVLLVAGFDYVAEVYFSNQLSLIGLTINGTIFALFLLGMAKMVVLLRRYSREERALALFVEEMERGGQQPGAGVDERALIQRRLRMMVSLHRQRSPINHSALAATLSADESTLLTLPRFINNILILTGVFGTIVSLSIALVGASNLLEAGAGGSDGLGDMGLIIHGMSTALSTTITAIVCYLFYGYIYVKVADVQTRLLSGVEQVTGLYLMPRYSTTQETVLHDVAGLVRALQDVAESMRDTQGEYGESAERLHRVVKALELRVDPLGSDVQQIKGLLREGFRLPEAGK